VSSLTPKDEVLPPLVIHALRADEPDPARISRLYREFQRSSGGRARVGRRALVLAVVLAVGAAAAAVRSLDRVDRVVEAPRPAATALRAPVPPVHQAVPSAAPSAVASAPSASHGRPGEKSKPPPAASVQSRAWQRAARAFRVSDVAGAERALLDIESRAPSNEAEAARLARAQLLLANGRGPEAGALLRSLSERALTASVRQRAGELLESSHDRPSAPTPASN
jgi:hypothetical protein